MASTKMKIIVKDLNEFAESQVIKCKSYWSIKKLKKHLQNVLPSKPKARRQHLIYVGRILRNSSRLFELLPVHSEDIVKIHLICSISRSANRKASKKLKRALWSRHFGCQDASTSTHGDNSDQNSTHDVLYESAMKEVLEMSGLAESFARNPNDEMLKVVYQAYLDQIYYHITLKNNSMNDFERPCIEDVIEAIAARQALEEEPEEVECVDQDVANLQNVPQAPDQPQNQPRGQIRNLSQTHLRNQLQAQPQDQVQGQPQNQPQTHGQIRNLSQNRRQNQVQAQPQDQVQAQPQDQVQAQPQDQVQGQPQNQPQPQPQPAQGEEEGPDFIDWLYLAFRIISVVLFAYSNSTFLRSMAALCIMIVVSIIPHLVLLEVQRRAEFNLPRPEIPANANWPTQLRAILNLFILSLIPDLI